MASQITFCQTCAHPVEKKGPTHLWMCLKHQNHGGQGFVSEEFWEGDRPYLRCVTVNGGACPLYEEAPEGSDSTEAERTARGKKRGE